VTDVLTIVFIGAALICVVAGVAAVRRTQRRIRDNDEEYGSDDGEATYAEEAAAVAAAESAALDDPADGEAPPA
jgi:hypothetical protein